ncbi:hypothetical protein HYZ97_05165 [Candidatus Pacearchaeota archaeon]|nr:hypothetical protein [Candidatus Pacearchaeota archaeon]
MVRKRGSSASPVSRFFSSPLTGIAALVILLLVLFLVYAIFIANPPLLSPDEEEPEYEQGVSEGTELPEPDPECIDSTGQIVYGDRAPGKSCILCDANGQADRVTLNGQSSYNADGTVYGNGCQICSDGDVVDTPDGNAPKGKQNADAECSLCEGGFPKARYTSDSDSIDFWSCTQCSGMKRVSYPGDGLDVASDSCVTCTPERNQGMKPGYYSAGTSCSKIVDMFGKEQTLSGGSCILDEHLNLLGESSEFTKAEILLKIQSAASSRDSDKSNPSSCVCTSSGECKPGEYKKTLALPPKSLATFGVVQCTGFGTNLQTGEESCGYWQPEQTPYLQECNPCTQVFDTKFGCLPVDAAHIKDFIAGKTACKYKTFFGKIKTGLCTEAGTCKKGCPSGCLLLDAGATPGQTTPESLANDAGYDIASCPLQDSNPLHGTFVKLDFDKDGTVDEIDRYVCF